MILVTTAGKVGSETARLLATQGETVRAVVHQPEKAAALRRSGVEVLQGDLEVPDNVERALRGVDTVVLVTAPVVHQELNVIAAASHAGVQHVVKLTSKASHDSPIARRRHQAEIEGALVESGLSYTLIRSNAYMQNFLMLASGIAQTDTFSSASGDGRVGYIDVGDVAAVAAALTAAPAEHAGCTYWPTGPEALSGKETATQFSQVLGRTITFNAISYEEQQRAMIEAGLPQSAAEDNARALALMADGDCDYVTDDVDRLVGRSASSFTQFVAEHAAAFS